MREKLNEVRMAIGAERRRAGLAGVLRSSGSHIDGTPRRNGGG
jgi:hypothetical protein